MAKLWKYEWSRWALNIIFTRHQTTHDKLTYTRHDPIGVCVSAVVFPTWSPLTVTSGDNRAMELPKSVLRIARGRVRTDNFAVNMAIWKLAPALATGNTVVLKPAELTPFSALKIAELAREAGYPPGVINVVPGYGDVAGEALASHRGVGKIGFTGSTANGRKIMGASARSNLKRMTMELGGKNACIIFDDADLTKTIPNVAISLL